MTEIDFADPFWQHKKALTDSRKLTVPERTIFFAIAGERHNGHDFVNALYEKGVRHFVVEQSLNPAIFQLPKIEIISAASSVRALQNWAAFQREKFNIPVIAITGSNGKTIVKEWLFAQLEEEYRVVKSPKSYNSQIGVPLSVLEMNERHEIALFEAGISQLNEMQNLKNTILPTIGIFTNIGTAHDENFSGIEEKIVEKAKLFEEADVLIYSSDHEVLSLFLEKLPAEKFTWGESEEATVRYELMEKRNGNLTVRIYFEGHVTLVYLPFSDQASFENCMTCLTALLMLGYPLDILQEKVNLLKNNRPSVGMRLELKQGIHHSLLINDAYNNDLAGLAIALDFMDQQDHSRARTLILSDLLESGLSVEELYRNVRILAESKAVVRFIGVGRVLAASADLFDGVMEVHFFTTTVALLEAIQNEELSFAHELILVKGARHYAFEQVTRLLEQKVHGTRLEINLDALTHNLNFFRSLLKSTTQIMVMVKGFGYGSGSLEVAHLLQYHLVDYLGVAYADEGVTLREGGIRLPIMVLNPPEEAFEKLLQFDLEPEVYSFPQLEAFLDYLAQEAPIEKLPYPIHINLDTGMARLGFSEAEIKELAEYLAQHNDLIKVSSIYSHLVGADGEEHEAFTQAQIQLFVKGYDTLSKILEYAPTRHILNSAGITRFPEAQFDMVRLGIGLYGVELNNRYQDSLQPISTLKTNISQIRELEKGQTVGYGRWGKIEKPSRIAVIAIGYADGFSRSFSRGNGRVQINGKFAPIIGNVCMDMTMVDVTEIEAEEGDEVVIFGKEPTISELAASIHTIPYEILTNIGERVKRIYFSE